jgi:hypothetical protein
MKSPLDQPATVVEVRDLCERKSSWITDIGCFRYGKNRPDLERVLHKNLTTRDTARLKMLHKTLPLFSISRIVREEYWLFVEFLKESAGNDPRRAT